MKRLGMKSSIRILATATARDAAGAVAVTQRKLTLKTGQRAR